MSFLNDPLNRPLRMALVGGGGQAFIGRVHWTAATLDNRAELVAGAFSSNAEKARDSASAFGITGQQAYGSYEELIAHQSQLPQDGRIDFVSIATPNYTHFDIASAALAAGFNVVCDKPMTTKLVQAEQMVRLVEQSGAVFALTHNYSGYPLVRQARQMVLGGEMGEIQGVRVNYIQGWMRGLEPGTTPARGAWKDDPDQAGPSGALADVGTHAYQLLRFITGLRPVEVAAQLMTYQPGRTLDDYGHVMIRCDNQAVGMITVSQVTHGRLNDLAIEVDGTKGSLSWRQEEPNELVVRRFGQPVQIYERNPMASFTVKSARSACRLPGGHPEAFFEAFANIYRDAFDDMIARASNRSFGGTETIYPNVRDGLEGVYFIEQCVASSNENCTWKPLKHELAR